LAFSLNVSLLISSIELLVSVPVLSVLGSVVYVKAMELVLFLVRYVLFFFALMTIIAFCFRAFVLPSPLVLYKVGIVCQRIGNVFPFWLFVYTLGTI
jgi:hypothetical protein